MKVCSDIVRFLARQERERLEDGFCHREGGVESWGDGLLWGGNIGACGWSLVRDESWLRNWGGGLCSWRSAEWFFGVRWCCCRCLVQAGPEGGGSERWASGLLERKGKSPRERRAGEHFERAMSCLQLCLVVWLN